VVARDRVSFDGCQLRIGGVNHHQDSMERTMASVCEVCGKRPGFGKNVSFSHRRTSRRWNPNIQVVHAMVRGTRKRMNVCTSCIKAGKITR
jgi:large subunit ribosomal protein L28